MQQHLHGILCLMRRPHALAITKVAHALLLEEILFLGALRVYERGIGIASESGGVRSVVVVFVGIRSRHGFKVCDAVYLVELLELIACVACFGAKVPFVFLRATVASVPMIFHLYLCSLECP